MKSAVAVRIPSYLLLGCGSLLVACGGEATPEPMAPQPGEPSNAPQTTTSVGPAQVSVEGPKRISCKLESNDWRGNPIKLRTGPTGAPFLVVGPGAALTVSLPTTRAEGYFVEVEKGAVKARGYLKAEELPLYAAAAAELKGFAIPTPGAELSFLKGSPDSVYYDFNLDSKRARPAQGSDKNTKPCAFFSLEKKEFNPLSASGSSAQKTVAIKPGHYDLLGEPQGPAVGSIDIDEKSPYATLLAKNGPKSRIAYPVGDVMVLGWLDSLKLVEQRETIKTGTTVQVPAKGAPSERKTGVDTWQKVKCPTEVKLFADIGATRHLVGRVKASESVQLGPAQGSVRGVAFPDVDVMAADAAKLFVEVNETAKCQ